MVRASLLLMTLAGAAHATEHEVAAYGHILDTCYQAASAGGTHESCVGLMASTCMESEEGGHSTLGMTFCTWGEAQVWDRYLNIEYRETMAALRAMDADTAVHFPEFANRAESLREAQRAWIAFRDAECGLAYAMWGSGSMRNIASANCRLEMVSERAIELRNLGSEMR